MAIPTEKSPLLGGNATDGDSDKETPAVKFKRLEPQNLTWRKKPLHIKLLKIICLSVHAWTIIVYTTATICFCVGVMAHSDPITLKTGHKYLDYISVRFNPLMSEERVFIVVVMFVGVILTSYDCICIYLDDLHLVATGRFPEHMVFMFLIKMFAAMFLFSPRFMQVYWIRTGFWIIMFTVPRFLFTASMGAMVRQEVRKEI